MVAAPGLSWARLALTVVCVPIAGLVLHVACDFKDARARFDRGRVTAVGEKAAAVMAAVVTVAAAALVAARAV